ncbi:MAG: calcineurin-like phosphoesterase C-terminal domain-containing protein [Alistipes sp.]|nr:calcineurin-like phosphoesterase C-terminal domain-containing protein [Alistipes sp.]
MKRLFNLLTLLVLAATSVSAQSTYTSTAKVSPKRGTTIYGVVECDGKPLQGVAVSDGYQIVLTDKKGTYQLQSAKRNGNVFITIPSGYEAPTSTETFDPVPQFWAHLTADSATPERHDFTLKAVNNRNHVMLAITDIHLSNQLGDLDQFNNVVMPRIREEVEKYRKQGIPVYTMCMGDSSFDLFWYDFLFDIADFRETLRQNKYPTTMFHTMGNHDNDGATPQSEQTDFEATAAYRKAFGPTYYSFNIGGVHYIMLDNIFYHNEPNPKAKKGGGMAGARNHTSGISAEQVEWLKKDLALVADKSTPIVVGMHCPVYRFRKPGGTELMTYFHNAERKRDLAPALEFSSLFKEFEQVHYVSGHTHKLYTTRCKLDTSHPVLANTIDHNVGGICGAWWFTGAHGGLHLAPDGAPAGFKVFTMNDRNIEWYYTSANDGAQKQFRAFDLNEVSKYYAASGEIQVFLKNHDKRTKFSDIKPNRVAIHIWDWDPEWKISVKENGKELPVVHRAMENPQYTLSYYIPKTVWRRDLFVPRYNNVERSAHMFHVTASAPDTTLEITVTDPFGRTYTEIMERPKAFSKLMR